MLLRAELNEARFRLGSFPKFPVSLETELAISSVSVGYGSDQHETMVKKKFQPELFRANFLNIYTYI